VEVDFKLGHDDVEDLLLVHLEEVLLDVQGLLDDDEELVHGVL